MSTDLNRAPFPYPGSKARHADWILEHIPEHRTYVEPFGGAAGVLFQKPESKVEVYNDRDGDLVQFFEVLRERPDDLVEWLEAVPFAREVYDEWAEAFYNENHRPDDPVERAGRFYALRYMNFGGKVASKAGFSTGAVPGGPNGGAFGRSIGGLTDYASRLRTAVIECLDWSDVVEKYDTPETVFYCDPPYDGTEDYYNAGDFDHRALHDALLEAEGRAVVSYDAVPPFYGDEWHVATKDSTFHIDNTDGSGPKDCTEVLLMNFDGEGEPVMSGVGQQTLESVGD
jgi:DNA adenine methylase